VLHASSVVLDQGTVGFMAPSGSGKSTLALALARRGAIILSDDSLVLDRRDTGAVARPLWSSVRVHEEDLSEALWQRAPSAVYGKTAIDEKVDPTLRFARQESRLRAIYVLGESPTIEIERLAPREALLAVLREAYHLEFDDMVGVEGLMLRIEQLELTRRTYALRYPRDFACLDSVCERVAAHAAGL
jgi:serine kinase of HPr protein (carbohydrate metabolism regulator)